MKTQMINAASWFNADPRRAKLVTFLAMASLFVAAHLAPGVALAGPIGGGADIGGV
jgi:hypothetical protein